jgi:hypothetical protein
MSIPKPGSPTAAAHQRSQHPTLDQLLPWNWKTSTAKLAA